MPEIKLENVTKRWGNYYGVDNMNMTIDNNAFVVLLGPSGCGKTTTLRMIAGLETPTTGKITIGDRVVFDSSQGINIPPNKRKVGFLFQNYALWPNMTVYENISFGLSNIKEEMVKVDFDAKNDARLAEILFSPQDVVKVLDECKDKNGKLNENKAIIKLIDAFTISQYTAKRLYGYHLETGKDVSGEAKALAGKAEAAKKSKNLNENFEYTSGGKVVREVRKMTKEEIDLSVRRVSRIVKISMFMDRYPAELSGGQQQRVAIARTLAPEPSVLFMDEPLSNLDAKLRLEMRYELQRLHVETGSTFVYVTHDQMEAMTLSTNICLINNGVLQQYEPPLTVYNHPNNLFVADFVGNPSINFINAKGTQNANDEFDLTIFDGVKVRFGGDKVPNYNKWLSDLQTKVEEDAAELKERAKKKDYVEKSNKDEVFKYHIQRVEDENDAMQEEPILSDEDFVIGVRPEFISINEKGKLKGEIYGAMPTGMESTVKIRVNDYLLTGVVFGNTVFSIGSYVNMDFIGDNVILFHRKSGKIISTGKLEII